MEKIAILFNKETSEYFEDVELYNSTMFVNIEGYLKTMLFSQGFISLYDIKKCLGMKVTIDDLRYYIDDIDNCTFESTSLGDGEIRIVLLMKKI